MSVLIKYDADLFRFIRYLLDNWQVIPNTIPRQFYPRGYDSYSKYGPVKLPLEEVYYKWQLEINPPDVDKVEYSEYKPKYIFEIWKQ